MNNGIVTTPRYFAVEYDFNIDDGIVGNIPTGLTIPGGLMMYSFFVQNVVTCVGAGASINFGIIGNLTLYGSYPAAVFGQNHAAYPIITTVESEVIISIATNPITAGKIFVTWKLAVTVGR